MMDDSEDWKTYKDMWDDTTYSSSSCRFHWFPDTGMKVSWCKYCGKEGVWEWKTQTYVDIKTPPEEDKSSD